MYDNNFRIEGTIKNRFETIQVTDKFSKREFVLSVSRPEDNKVELIKFQCLNVGTKLLDEIRVGNRVIVEFKVSGRKWDKGGEEVYFTNLDCLSIDILDPTNLEEHTTDTKQDVLYTDQIDVSEHIVPKEDKLEPPDKYSDLPF